MPQEIRFASFNVCNLAPPGTLFYANLPPYTQAEYEAKLDWIADRLDRLDADVIGFQEIFSQSALKEALARTAKYRDAFHAGVDPDPAVVPQTPSVALVSRLPFAAPPCSHAALPARLVRDVPPMDKPMTRFKRPVLHARVTAANGLAIHVLVLHLKSKRPDFLEGDDESDPYLFDLASLRSLYRRGVEAIGLRNLLSGLMQSAPAPLVALGDFNDGIDAVTTELVMGIGRAGESQSARRMYDSAAIQTHGKTARQDRYTHLHDGEVHTIDHILVSRDFHPEYAGAAGRVIEVSYLNDHLALRTPQASDHGLVLARIALK